MIDVTDATFESEVVEASKRVAVVVDLWAPWCGPCRTLGPILESVIAETDGKVVLAKVNVDENPATSQAFRVQGIPAVYALRDGRVVDGFVGAQGEPAVRDFISRLIPSAVEVEIEQLLEAGDEESLRQVLDRVHDHHVAVPALAEILIARGESEAALALLARVPETAEVRRIAATARAGGVADEKGDVEATLAELLPRVKSDPEARQQYVDLLEVMGPDDPRTAEYRKQLSMRLF